MSRRAIARINLAALRHNLQRVRDYAPESKVMAAIKAEGYGHGVLQVANALHDADALAVASMEEAVQLRFAGEQRPIVVLAGFQGIDEARQASDQRLQVVIHDDSQLESLGELEKAFKLAVWIKVDTGMHRLGFAVDSVESVAGRISAMPNLELIGWMTHFACADNPEDALTQRQLDCFTAAVQGQAGLHSIANSAGIVTRPDSHADWVRPGIMLYGSSPIIDRWPDEFDLQPVMSLESILISVHNIKAGEGIGYGQTWACPEDMPVGVVGIGYGDGYPRHAPNGTPVWINHTEVPLVGRVSMDMICVDLRECPQAKAGDVAELWGSNVPVDRVARMAGTISYELFCRLTSRVEFKYEG